MKKTSSYQKLKESLRDAKNENENLRKEIARYIFGEMSPMEKITFEYIARLPRTLENMIWCGEPTTIKYGIKTKKRGSRER